MPTADIETLSIDTIRCLAMDAVQKANAGHPGTAMALAPVAYVLFRERMRHDPADPLWPDRDRFVLSAGHACMLQYAALHLSGYDLTLDDLKQFRQWESRTPGHPELVRGQQLTPGVEISTGPLGQGVGNAVGMALAEAMLADALQRRRLAARRSPDVRDLLGRRRHGGRGVRGELARRLPRARQALPDLRRQPHHDRGLDGPRVRRGRRAALRGLRLPRPAARRRLDDRRPARRARRRRRRGVAPVADRRAHAHRDRRPARAGHAGVARRAARRGGGAPHQAGLRLGSRPQLLRAGRGLRALLPARARRGRRTLPGMRLHAAQLAPTTPREFDRVLAGDAAGRLGGCAARPLGRRPAGDARQLGRLHRGARSGDPRAHRRLGRPRAVEQLARSRARPRSPARRSRTRRTRWRTRCCPAAWAAARCTSASASTAWARSSTASWCTAGSARSAPRSSCSPTTCGRPCASPASWSCRSSTSGRTTRSGSARTARRTSRSSTSPRCAPCRTCA